MKNWKISVLVSAFMSLFSASACSSPEHGDVMDRNRALALAEAVESSTRVEHFDDGSFRGFFGAAEIEFVQKENLLIARGHIMNQAEDMLRNDKIIGAFEKAASEKPESTAGGYFELHEKPYRHRTDKLRSDKDIRFSLRRDFTDPAIDSDDFVNAVSELTTAAYRWQRRFIDVLGKSDVFD